MEDTRLLDSGSGSYPVISADGLGDVQFIGPNVQLYVFGWRKIGGVWRKVVSGLVIRPSTSLRPEQITIFRKLFGAEASDQVVRH